MRTRPRRCTCSRLKRTCIGNVCHSRKCSGLGGEIFSAIQGPGQVQQGYGAASATVRMRCCDHLAIHTKTGLLQRYEAELGNIHFFSPCALLSVPSSRYCMATATVSESGVALSGPGHGGIPNPIF